MTKNRFLDTFLPFRFENTTYNIIRHSVPYSALCGKIMVMSDRFINWNIFAKYSGKPQLAWLIRGTFELNPSAYVFARFFRLFHFVFGAFFFNVEIQRFKMKMYVFLRTFVFVSLVWIVGGCICARERFGFGCDLFALNIGIGRWDLRA